MTELKERVAAKPLAWEELLGIEGRIIFVARLGGDGWDGACAEPYLMFGPKRRMYGLDTVPDFDDYGSRWLAFDTEPTQQQLHGLFQAAEAS